MRSGIALLCAHWEGFIRSVANYYVVYISCKKVPSKDIKKNFIALKAKKEINKAGKSEKTSVHTKLLDYIEDICDKNFFIKYTESNRIIQTNSNLSYELFAEILNSISINNIYELKKQYIDRNLLKARHEIVHGEKTELINEDFVDTYNHVINIMESFKAQVIEAANNELYKLAE